MYLDDLSCCGQECLAWQILKKMLNVEWIGQTMASLCWIVSVFVYSDGSLPEGNGDWLFIAASSWMIANIARFSQLKEIS